MIQVTVWMVWLSEVAASHFENPVSRASIGRLLLFRRRQAVGQLLAIRQNHLAQEAALLAVAQRQIVEGRMIAGLQRALGPAGAGEDAGARHLEHPGAGLRPVLG